MEDNIKKMSDETARLAKDAAENARKLGGAWETLKQIEEVEIATSKKELVWNDGKVRLFRYSSDARTEKTPLLIVYALVNKYEMMDLQPDRSFIRNLLDQGHDIYLIDWGYADRSDRYLTMDDYINGYVDDAVDFVRKAHKLPAIDLLGVCQGGTFSVIYSALHPEKVRRLITMVTPIDFSTEDGLLFRWSRNLDIDTIVDGFGGVVPGWFLNMGFDQLKPLGKVRKYSGFVNMLDDKDKLLNYLRMEKWIADSPDQAGECYRQFLKDLYQQNKLMKGELVVGSPVDLKNLTMPLLNIYAAEDHLVPPSASKPLNVLVGSKDKQLYEFPGGHIGVFVGNRSQKELAPTVSKWLKA
ncbi:MAG: class III poly(R)-hydroxyalkanoic acid synthase subunit PhaC [Bacteroidota bacterium]